MARRSPANARYQKYTGPEGKTRKSASQAKPKRSSSGPGASTAKSKTGAKGSSAARAKVAETPEYKAARKLWWILLGVGLVMTAASWLIRGYVHTTWANAASAIALGIAYAMIFYALYIDWTQLRPARKAMISGKPVPKAAAKTSSKKDTVDHAAVSADNVEEHDSADRKDA
jgi:hypothetical protein